MFNLEEWRAGVLAANHDGDELWFYVLLGTMVMNSGATYFSGAASARQLYVALTNRCNSRTLPETRGPGFAMASFSPLSPPDWEPSEDEVVAAVERALGLPLSSSGEHAPPLAPTSSSLVPPLCFAGLGEPLLRSAVLVGATKRLRARTPNLSVRITTNGLVAAPGPLIATLADAGVSSVSVALAAADATSYHRLMRPDTLLVPYSSHTAEPAAPEPATPEAAFDAVCAFVREAAAAGLRVECTAVAAPGIDVERAGALARALGATDWRVREYFK
jgi:hypothetical protein